MKRLLLVITVIMSIHCAAFSNDAMPYRGVVYDVGIQFQPGSFSVENFDSCLVDYDMGIISNILAANTVRVEGEDIERLVKASEIAHGHGLRVFFNPWLTDAGAGDVKSYMRKAAKAAEELRQKGVDIVFVMGCEYSFFCDGVFDGSNINERLLSMISLFQKSDYAGLASANAELNRILGDIASAVREEYKGLLTYSSGTWEQIDWTPFDIVGVDYYREKQSDEEYLAGLKPYFEIGKPVYVMEVGCCTYIGAAERGAQGFTILQGVDADGKPVYESGSAPVRSESEQADYDEAQIRILSGSGIEGMFIYLFSFPIYPHREDGFDADLTAYAIVKTFPTDDPRSQLLPPWQPKEAFYRIADAYRALAGLSDK